MRPATPPRLGSFDYRGLHRYFLTICTKGRRPTFCVPDIVEPARKRLFEEASNRGFSAYAYCFMPDHCHVLVIGVQEDAGFVQFVNVFKQTTSFDFKRKCRGTLWQAGYFERVLRSDEASMSVARYILENPVRAGLTRTFQEYPFSGSQEFTKEALADLWATRT